jgi:hypothetical protein
MIASIVSLRRNPARWVPAVLGLGLGLLALGPGLRRGFLLSYDMVFVPREPFAAALPASGPPRVVPSDLVFAAASRVLPADITQKLVLLLIFVLGCAGAAALLDREPLMARLAAGVCYVWNPYLAERLIIGQWALLLGYAGLPLAVRAAAKPDLASPRGALRLACALLPAVIGGFTAMAVTALAVVPVALLRRNAGHAAVALAALAVGSLPWIIPSLLRPVYADPAGVAAFAARADTPFGTVGSLLMLGGTWNAQTVPKAYGGAWSALWLAVVIAAIAGYAALGRRRWPGLPIAAVAGLAIASIGVTAPGRDLLVNATRLWPGFAVLRDGQQFIAPLALVEALGLGLAVNWAMNPGSFGTDRKTARHRRTLSADLPGTALGAIALLAPVLLLPGLAAGAAGRLRPAEYPASWLAAARAIDASPAQGDVLLLPWAADRAPSWNHGEVMLDPWPRLLSRPVIWNDGTRVGDVRLAPEDPRARALDGVISSAAPLTAALRAAGVRFVIIDTDPGDSENPVTRLPGARALITQPRLQIYVVPGLHFE